MDTFDVPTKENDVLRTSLLVEELITEASEIELYPVLFGTHIGHFHDVGGGYAPAGDGYHLVNLIHEVQGPDSPFKENVRHSDVEIHLDNYWNLDVTGVTVYDNYPDEDYVVSLKVDNYKSGPYSFSEELQANVDSRETRFEK